MEASFPRAGAATADCLSGGFTAGLYRYYCALQIPICSIHQNGFNASSISQHRGFQKVWLIVAYESVSIRIYRVADDQLIAAPLKLSLPGMLLPTSQESAGGIPFVAQ
jgi:hypothetical protein